MHGGCFATVAYRSLRSLWLPPSFFLRTQQACPDGKGAGSACIPNTMSSSMTSSFSHLKAPSCPLNPYLPTPCGSHDYGRLPTTSTSWEKPLAHPQLRRSSCNCGPSILTCHHVLFAASSSPLPSSLLLILQTKAPQAPFHSPQVSWLLLVILPGLNFGTNYLHHSCYWHMHVNYILHLGTFAPFYHVLLSVYAYPRCAAYSPLHCGVSASYFSHNTSSQSPFSSLIITTACSTSPSCCWSPLRGPHKNVRLSLNPMLGF